MGDNFKNLLIKDGMLATYKSFNKLQKVAISNVEKEGQYVFFYIRDVKTNKLLTWPNGLDLKLRADIAFEQKTIVIDNPIFVTDDTNEMVVKIDFDKEKRQRLKQFYLNNVTMDGKPFVLDDEQLNAVMSNRNTIITARAGSGKTRVLIAKIIKLFEKDGLSQDEVLAFCFNRYASKEISRRLNDGCLIKGEKKYQDYDIAKTFHSFSKMVCEPFGILDDDKINLIKAIIKHNKNNDEEFSNKVYKFFRDASLRIDKKTFNNAEDYYKYIRNSNYVTLNGEKVKSKQEKFIADYLFEHGIDYIYEKSFYPSKIDLFKSGINKNDEQELMRLLESKKEIKPDFYIQGKNLVWEHWAIDGNEDEEAKDGFNKRVGDYEEYLATQQWKKKFWDKSWISKLNASNKYNSFLKQVKGFIETYNNQLKDYTREEFECVIEDLLKRYGIYNKKLAKNVLIEKAWGRAIDTFTKLIEQFINKLQQKYFDNLDRFFEDASSIKDERIQAFYELGMQVYKQYLEVLNNNNNIGEFAIYNRYSLDFNQLIYECTKLISEGKMDDYIKNLKWILIDEYQDFTALFNNLIDSILKRNPNIKLFCVGDDWQAINRFAGSDLEYFKNFTKHYDNSIRLNVRTNYRSESQIVDFANIFMEKFNISGAKPISFKRYGTGKCEEIDISNLFIGKQEEDNIYLKYLDELEHDKYNKARYLKKCSDIIRDNVDKKIMILNRSNQILHKDLAEFERVLQKICTSFMSIENYKNNVQVKTVHKSKGEEADIVILLNINENIFPVFNSSNALFEIFGESLKDAYEDEKRLYYVALTRAKNELYILYDEADKSEFVIN